MIYKAKVKNWEELSESEQWVEGFHLETKDVFCNEENFIILKENDEWKRVEIDPDTICEVDSKKHVDFTTYRDVMSMLIKFS